MSTPANASIITSSDRAAQKPVSTNNSSKKRAKTRKQGGLQALLEKSKENCNSSSGPGLDLMDLMRQI